LWKRAVRLALARSAYAKETVIFREYRVRRDESRARSRSIDRRSKEQDIGNGLQPWKFLANIKTINTCIVD
jgi:hypothetical protein